MNSKVEIPLLLDSVLKWNQGLGLADLVILVDFDDFMTLVQILVSVYCSLNKNYVMI